jgi:hypothetical protein
MFTSKVHTPDEDGYSWIEIFDDGKRVSTHSVRFDHARQWAAQECECLNETPEERSAYLAPFGQGWLDEQEER